MVSNAEFDRLNWTTWQPRSTDKADILRVIAAKIGGDEIDAIDAIMALLDGAGWRWADQNVLIDPRGQYPPFAACHTFAQVAAAAFMLYQKFQINGWL